MLILLTAATIIVGAQSATGPTWIRSDEDGALGFELREGARRDGEVLLTMLLKPRNYQPEGSVLESDQRFDCRAQTATAEAGRHYDAAGVELRAVEVPPEFQRPEPIFADDVLGDIYVAVCPNRPALPTAPRRGPPPVPAPRG